MCIPSIHDPEMKLVRHDQRFSSISSTWEPYSASFQPFSCRPRIPIKIIHVFGEQIDIPNSVLFTMQVPFKLHRTAFPTRDQQVGVRTVFVQEALDLQYWSMILASNAVDVSKHLDTLTLEFSAIPCDLSAC